MGQAQDSRASTRVLVLGATGMLGHKLIQQLSGRFQVKGTVRSHEGELLLGLLGIPGSMVLRACAEDMRSVAAAMDDARPDAVINCIGVVKQRTEAKDPETSIGINALFPHRLAKLCRGRGVRLIHLSTDCVFSGHGGGYRETDPADATDLYGRSKLLGEVDGEGCLTIRTSIIGRELVASRGLVEWFLSQRGRTIQGYRRAIYSGFPTRTLADILVWLLNEHPDLSGIWHVASSAISKYDLLELAKRAMDLDVRIEPDDSFVCDRSLDARAFRDATGFTPPAWPEMIAAMCSDPTPYEEIRQQAVAGGGVAAQTVTE